MKGKGEAMKPGVSNSIWKSGTEADWITEQHGGKQEGAESGKGAPDGSPSGKDGPPTSPFQPAADEQRLQVGLAAHEVAVELHRVGGIALAQDCFHEFGAHHRA